MRPSRSAGSTGRSRAPKVVDQSVEDGFEILDTARGPQDLHPTLNSRNERGRGARRIQFRPDLAGRLHRLDPGHDVSPPLRQQCSDHFIGPRRSARLGQQRPERTVRSLSAVAGDNAPRGADSVAFACRRAPATVEVVKSAFTWIRATIVMTTMTVAMIGIVHRSKASIA